MLIVIEVKTELPVIMLKEKKQAPANSCKRLMRRERYLKLVEICADYQSDRQILSLFYIFVHTILFTSSKNGIVSGDFFFKNTP